MKGRIWNSWTTFDSDNEPDRDRMGGQGQSLGRSNRSKSIDGSPSGFERSVQRTMASALERAMDMSEVRMERVARVKAAMAANGYDVPASELAKKLLQAMLRDFR